MGGISKEQLAAIINRSRDLCSEAGDAMISRSSSKTSNRSIDADPSDYDGDAAYFDSLYSDSINEDYEHDYKSSGRDITFSKDAIKSSKMDDRIKESLANNPIDRSSLYEESVLDGLNIPKKQQKRRQVNEDVIRSTSTVDYALIKTIVNECINDYFSKKAINESATLSAIGLKDGVIKLVDNKGNVFSAKLQKIGTKNNGQS